jgi:hypothetical protein
MKYHATVSNHCYDSCGKQRQVPVYLANCKKPTPPSTPIFGVHSMSLETSLHNRDRFIYWMQPCAGSTMLQGSLPQ